MKRSYSLLFVFCACLLISITLFSFACTEKKSKWVDHETFKYESAAWDSDYEEYIKEYPAGKYVIKAKEKLASLKSQNADYAIEYPKEIEPVISADGALVWRWTTSFLEKGGKIPFKVTGKGVVVDAGCNRLYREELFHRPPNLIDAKAIDKELKDIERGVLRIPAGEKISSEYSLADDGSHAFCNGYALFQWVGKDAGGHSIFIEEKVHLLHKFCLRNDGHRRTKSSLVEKGAPFIQCPLIHYPRFDVVGFDGEPLATVQKAFSKPLSQEWPY